MKIICFLYQILDIRISHCFSYTSSNTIYSKLKDFLEIKQKKRLIVYHDVIIRIYIDMVLK